MIEKVKKTIIKYAWLPLISGMIGYWYMGELSFVDSLYATIALYFVNPVSDLNNTFVYISKFTAIVVTTTVVLDFLLSFFRLFEKWYNLRFKDSIAIYIDSDPVVIDYLNRAIKHGIIVTNNMKVERKARRHVILYNDDKKALEFYTMHLIDLKRKKVYFVVNELNSFLLGTLNNVDSELHFINKNELIAREYWKNNSLLAQLTERNKKKSINIGIVGFDNVGLAIFQHGFMNNVFFRDQKIEYHIWGCDSINRSFISSLITMNNDCIIVHDDNPLNQLNELSIMDRVIIAESNDILRIVQELLYKNRSLPIYYYSEAGINLNAIYGSATLIPFGNKEEIINIDNIINERLYRSGKLINYDYVLKNKDTYTSSPLVIDEEELERSWRNASGYERSSSIASADHYFIKKELLTNRAITDSEMQEIEHIRWCRFMYINHYRHGMVKDAKKLEHPYLVSYCDLPDSEKEKGIISSDIIRRELDKIS